MSTIAHMRDRVFREFPDATDLGSYNRRKIRNSTAWSQHAYPTGRTANCGLVGNALDIGVRRNGRNDLALGDRIAAWLEDEYGPAQLRRFANGYLALWRTSAHWDHLHVEQLPTLRGTPPTTDEAHRLFPPDQCGQLPIGDDDMLRKGDTGLDVVRFQESLVALGHPLPTFGADGDWGGETSAAVAAFKSLHGFAGSGDEAADRIVAFAMALVADQNSGGSHPHPFAAADHRHGLDLGDATGPVI